MALAILCPRSAALNDPRRVVPRGVRGFGYAAEGHYVAANTLAPEAAVGDGPPIVRQAMYRHLLYLETI